MWVNLPRSSSEDLIMQGTSARPLSVSWRSSSEVTRGSASPCRRINNSISTSGPMASRIIRLVINIVVLLRLLRHNHFHYRWLFNNAWPVCKGKGFFFTVIGEKLQGLIDISGKRMPKASQVEVVLPGDQGKDKLQPHHDPHDDACNLQQSGEQQHKKEAQPMSGRQNILF